jgi:hypothetical protein
MDPTGRIFRCIKANYKLQHLKIKRLKIDFNNKNVHFNSLLIRQSLEISKYKDKYDTLKLKSTNTIEHLTNSNNEKTETINKLMLERGEINC